jgi:hypothetical protein
VRDVFQRTPVVTAIAERVGCDRRTIRRWIATGAVDRDPATVAYGPRPAGPTKLDPYKPLIQERLATYPELTAVRHNLEEGKAEYRADMIENALLQKGVLNLNQLAILRRLHKLRDAAAHSFTSPSPGDALQYVTTAFRLIELLQKPKA